MKHILIASALFVMLAACQTTGSSSDSWCLTNAPQRPSKAEIVAMSDSRVRQVLSYNRLGAKRCGWKA